MRRPAASLPVEPVKSSYVQVASQLRSLILGRQLSLGERLPAEGELSAMFGVSRSTTREALRLLAAENLIETRRGVTGGTFVVHPEPSDIELALGTAIHLTAGTEKLSIDEVLEVWHLTQVPSARLAARRRTEEHIRALMDLSSPDVEALSDGDLTLRVMEFHRAMLKATGNRLLLLMVRPLSTVGIATLHRGNDVREFVEGANRRHRAIAEAIAVGDEELAASLMVDDLHQAEVNADDAIRDGPAAAGTRRSAGAPRA